MELNMLVKQAMMFKKIIEGRLYLSNFTKITNIKYFIYEFSRLYIKYH